MITILDDFPVILTKDENWRNLNEPQHYERAAIILLPEDAVLVMPPMLTMGGVDTIRDPDESQPDKEVDE